MLVPFIPLCVVVCVWGGEEEEGRSNGVRAYDTRRKEKKRKNMVSLGRVKRQNVQHTGCGAISTCVTCTTTSLSPTRHNTGPEPQPTHNNIIDGSVVPMTIPPTNVDRCMG